MICLINFTFHFDDIKNENEQKKTFTHAKKIDFAMTVSQSTELFSS